MKEEPGALQRGAKRSAIAEIALKHDVRRVQIGARARSPRQHADLVPARPERGRDGRSDKAARAGDERGRKPRRLARALTRRRHVRAASGVRRSKALSAATSHSQSLPNRGAGSKRWRKFQRARESGGSKVESLKGIDIILTSRLERITVFPNGAAGLVAAETSRLKERGPLPDSSSLMNGKGDRETKNGAKPLKTNDPAKSLIRRS